MLIEHDPGITRELREKNLSVLEGDATKDDILVQSWREQSDFIRRVRRAEVGKEFDKAGNH